MTYRQKTYGSLMLILAVVIVIGYVSDIKGAVLISLIIFLAVNLLFVEVGRYFIEGRQERKKARTYRQRHYAEFISAIAVNILAVYFLPFPSKVWIVLLAAFIINIITIEIKNALINESQH